MISSVRTPFTLAILPGAFLFSGSGSTAPVVIGSDGSRPSDTPRIVCEVPTSDVRIAQSLQRVRQAIREKGLTWKAEMSEAARTVRTTTFQLASSPLALNGTSAETVKVRALEELPHSFDWREYQGGDWTTPARNQGRCGACWAFVAVGIVEAQFNIFANNPDLDLDLSEQELISYHGDSGCGGGSELEALAYIRENGIVDEACLPYRGEDGQYPFCDDADDRRQWIEKPLRIEGSNPMTPQEIKSALITTGPVGVLIGARVRNDFKFYAGGIYEPTDTEPSLGAHSVLLVGYDDNQGCWMIKNSWGRPWGEDGFARLRYGVCDVEQNAYLRGAEVASLNLKDSDGDGFYDWVTGGDDCDDSDADVHPGQEYQIFYKDALTEPRWSAADRPIRAVASVTGVLDVSAMRMRFYQVMGTTPLRRDDDADGIPDSWRPAADLKPIRHEDEIGLTWSSIPPGDDLPGDGLDQDCNGQDAAKTLQKHPSK